MYEEKLYDVVLLENDKVTVSDHQDKRNDGHITGVFLSRKEAVQNAKKLSRQHGLEYVS